MKSFLAAAAGAGATLRKTLTRRTCLLAALALCAAPVAFAQSAIHLIVPYGAGGATDVLARLVAQGLTEQLKQSVIVENKPGASGVIGLEAIAKAAPDGMTIGMVASAVMGSYPAVETARGRPLKVDRLKDIVPLSVVGTVDNLLVANPAIPAKSMQELMAYGKAQPGGLFHATSGIDPSYLTMEYLKKQSGIKLTAVPFGGQAPGAQAVVAGHVQFMFLNAATAAPLIEAGKLRALAVAGPKRNPDFPDLPTTTEAGYPDMEMVSWIALVLPGKAPKAMVDRFHTALIATMADPGLQARSRKIGIEPSAGTPDELAARIRGDITKWTRIAREVPLEEAK